MSIPPLVCSTPPPPDQCEDDKEIEDFDLHYNLSPDDEDAFDYGSFPTYNHFQTSTQNDSKVADDSVINLVKDTVTTIEGDDFDMSTENKVLNENGTNNINKENKFDEDNNIEDLNLQIDNEVPAINHKAEILEEVNAKNDTIHKLDIEEITHINNEDIIISDSAQVVDEYCNNSINAQMNLEETLESFTDTPCELKDTTIECVTPDNREITVSPQSSFQDDNDKVVPVDENEIKMLSKLDDNDFEVFDNFNCFNNEAKPTTTLDNCDNPWEREEIKDISNDDDFGDFGDFKANFNENENTQQVDEQIKHYNNQLNSTIIQQNDDGDDDEFGDFNDFKSSAVENDANEAVHESPFQSMLNFQSNENDSQPIENINKIVTSIFVEDIQYTQDLKTEFKIKLESYLCETWGHLIDTDVRQPYMITWNNSLGQKTLLKALCIDSRNILFGPKWNSNMPKYAVNLTSAPLQPQKQSTSANVSQIDTVSSDNSCNKLAATWVDPFTSDGQESCSADSKEAKVRDIDVFETAELSKPNNVAIYSSTLNIQPLRQISLPDTHIFTPTDSETPRSKTFHYDSGPPVLTPQPILDDKDTAQVETICNTKNHFKNNLDNEDEYSDFQDFKGTVHMNTIPSKIDIDEVSKNTISNTLNTNFSFQTEILQPIKDPVIPTVNWPDPGEVKEVFEDFSDFVSNSSWNNEKHNVTSGSSIHHPNSIHPNSEKSDVHHVTRQEISSNDNLATRGIDKFDDEFDTFQSALPLAKGTNLELSNNVVISNPDKYILHNTPSNTSVLDFPFQDNNTKTETISYNNDRESRILTQNSIPLTVTNLNDVSTSRDIIHSQNSPIQSSGISNVLQPTQVNFTGIQTNKKCGQILQPLSLESYSQINWPNPGIDLQDLSKFNPVETLHSLKNEVFLHNQSKTASPMHSQKITSHNQVSDEDIWGDFVSSKPKQQQSSPKKTPMFADDDEWTDFVSSPIAKPQNGLNTISLNVHTGLNMQKTKNQSNLNQTPLDIPTLNYITPKSNIKTYNERHFQNL